MYTLGCIIVLLCVLYRGLLRHYLAVEVSGYTVCTVHYAHLHYELYICSLLYAEKNEIE